MSIQKQGPLEGLHLSISRLKGQGLIDLLQFYYFQEKRSHWFHCSCPHPFVYPFLWNIDSTNESKHHTELGLFCLEKVSSENLAPYHLAYKAPTLSRQLLTAACWSYSQWKMSENWRANGLLSTHVSSQNIIHSPMPDSVCDPSQLPPWPTWYSIS